MSCILSDAPLEIPENQGSVPSQPFVDSGGECIWTSDYAWATSGTAVVASEFETVALPSGRVHAWAAFPAEPVECPEEEAAIGPEASPEVAAETSPEVSPGA